ncbi:MAG: hypothetical protein EBZ52_03945 [Actinobacteria bacterium]|nr:hypothetical protein [Actinomycetota bacterium]
MKFFEAALILRQYSKSFPLLRKCIDFLPILSKLDKYFYQFARIRNEENIVSGYLLTAQSPKINLVCDIDYFITKSHIFNIFENIFIFNFS